MIITEQCGAQWTVFATKAGGNRAYWVRLVSGKSAAKPSIILGFYAPSIEAACDALNN